jgi:hypothetical protein
MTKIQKIIYLSKVVLILKLLKIKLNDWLIGIENIRIFIPNYKEYISIMIKDINGKISDINKQLGILLHPLLEGKYFCGYVTGDNWGLTEDQLRNGYIELEEIKTENIYILLLHDYKDIKAGTLIKFTNIPKKDLFGNLPSINSTYKSLLQNSIKLRKNDNN